MKTIINRSVEPRCTELLAVSRRAGKAIGDFDMIKEDDRIAVAVSGGKDSISLLHVLRHRQAVSPVKFEFAAVHIDFDFADFDPQKLMSYLENHGFPYHIEKVESLKGEKWEDIECFWWSRNRRKALFLFAERMGFNKIAFGHHMDDIVETVLLNQFYRGEIGAMRPRQELFGGKLTLIRPLAYEREEMMVRLAQKLDIETIGGQSRCANDETSHRMVIKKMLRAFEKDNPQIVKNIFRSLQNIRKDYLLEKVIIMNKFFLGLSMLGACFNTAWAGEISTTANEPFAVVELFSSEGCSSCPPADGLLRELTQDARAKGKRIFTLSFQVDYWNDSGWVDPYSRAEFTDRQLRYAEFLKSPSVYTPQMIVNGTNGFVGSRKDLALGAIERSFKIAPTNTISLKISKLDPREIVVFYETDQLSPDTELNIALVERGLKSVPHTGENAGRVLMHENVVREWKSALLTSRKGTVSIPWSAANDSGRFSVIAYLQKTKEMKIIAADSVDLAGGSLQK